MPVPKVNSPRARVGDVVIAGNDLERGIRQAMAREDVPSLSELARRSHVRRDTMYGWFRQPVVRVSPGSVEKLMAVLGAEPGDPWFEAPANDDMAALVRALDGLVEVMRQERSERGEWERGVLDALRELAEQQAAEPSDDPAPALPVGVQR